MKASFTVAEETPIGFKVANSFARHAARDWATL
jgi:hypothetical protein